MHTINYLLNIPCTLLYHHPQPHFTPFTVFHSTYFEFFLICSSFWWIFPKTFLHFRHFSTQFLNRSSFYCNLLLLLVLPFSCYVIRCCFFSDYPFFLTFSLNYTIHSLQFDEAGQRFQRFWPRQTLELNAWSCTSQLILLVKICIASQPFQLKPSMPF